MLLSKKISLINFLNTSFELQKETRIWRNSPQVTQYFKIPYIEEETHLKWLKSLTQTPPKSIAFIIKYENKKIGVTYFHSIDYSKKQADWGIYIHDENFRGKGLGTQTLEKCIKYAKENLNLKCLFLDVLDSNKIAIKLYENCGFKQIEYKNSFFRYQNIL